jgi:hypothetical protein
MDQDLPNKGQLEKDGLKLELKTKNPQFFIKIIEFVKKEYNKHKE